MATPQHPAVFLDRDGTIARDVHYCRRPEDFVLLPTVPRSVRLLNRHGFLVVVVTNQSGIARGYFDHQTLALIHEKMVSELAKGGARIDAIYYCPHHPEENCQCRKPRPALLLRAARELGIALPLSFVVGDAPMDIQAGKASGCRTVLVLSGPSPPPPLERDQAPDFTAPTLYQAARWIVKQLKQ